jgi:outer membrane protein
VSRAAAGWPILAVAVALAPPASRAQEAGDLPSPLTLKEAQSYALAHNPQLQAAELRASAALQGVREARSGFFPQVTANAVAVAAGAATRIAAPGSLNNPAIYQRESNGLLLSQLITDFGRTSSLTSSFRYQADSAAQVSQAVRALTLLEVSRTFFNTLGAREVLRVAEQTVASRQLLVDKVRALAEAKLKSSLDVSFAEVSLGEATLLELRAQDRLQGSSAQLAAALGLPSHTLPPLAEEPLVTERSDEVDDLIRTAVADRPELRALRAQREAAQKLSSAEKAARYPVITAIGAVGFSPYHDDRLEETYATAGLGLSLPIFTGGRLSAREQGAQLQANATAKVVEEQANGIERDVRIAWLDAHSAFKAIEVTQSLLDSASRALELAESRYTLGISSIVELSQAQLQKTEAEIANATARYDYQIKRATLDFQVGSLR